MSWRADAAGYDVFFNRDERHARAAETAPQPGRTGDTAWLAPRDGDHGGTWLLVNDRGLTVGLLNDYAHASAPVDSPRLSRGHVVLAAADAADLAGVAARVAALPLARCGAFTLFGVAPDGTSRAWGWDGNAFGEQLGKVGAAGGFLTSSSFDPAVVCAGRAQRFAVASAEAVRRGGRLDHAAFHRTHDPRHGAQSVLMRRADAATRSVSHVRVAAGTATFAHAPVRWRDDDAAPALEPENFVLPLARAVAAARE